MLTIGDFEIVYCVQSTGPVPTAIEWYNPQGQMVSRDRKNEVNQGHTGARAALLTFQSYQQSQGGKYECRVSVPGNSLEKLPVCIGEFNTLGDCRHLHIYVCLLYSYRQFIVIEIIQLNIID